MVRQKPRLTNVISPCRSVITTEVAVCSTARDSRRARAWASRRVVISSRVQTQPLLRVVRVQRGAEDRAPQDAAVLAAEGEIDIRELRLLQACVLRREVLEVLVREMDQAKALSLHLLGRVAEHGKARALASRIVRPANRRRSPRRCCPRGCGGAARPASGRFRRACGP